MASMPRGTLATNNANLVVGNAAAISRPFHGAVDEVRIWAQALSAERVQANMNVELSGAQVGLLAYYRFNEATDKLSVTAAATAEMRAGPTRLCRQPIQRGSEVG
ncbi:MAG: hypothetical protein IPJ97_17900 [Proteobacteria bacterium]|nr:hypothetical protein [Pseudomonadota bacterium]